MGIFENVNDLGFLWDKNQLYCVTFKVDLRSISGVNIDGKMLKVDTNMHIAEMCLKLILHMYIFIPQKSPFFHLEHQWGF